MSGPEKKIPTGRVGRFARLAMLGARTGASLIGGGKGDGAAEKAAEVLGTLRGLAAKVGQMASYVDGIVPEGKRDAYEASLKMLRSQAPRSSPEEIREVVESELGAPLSTLFTEWDEEPIASASIGQVHRARLPSGEEVAVKVQHANIREAVESDLASAGILEAFGAVGGMRRFDTKSQLEVIRSRFREELDYALEAERLLAFAAVHANDPTIVVPKLFRSHSRASVLTTEFLRGTSFDEACLAPEADRKAWAETLWRFVFRGNLVLGKFNADPHPGNYFFLPEGKVAFVDYGCVQEIDEPHRQLALGVHWAAVRRDEDAFRRGVSKMIDAKKGRLEDLALAYTRRCFEPLFGSPFRMTRTFSGSLVAGMTEMAKEAKKVPDAEFFTMPPSMLFMNRLQFGFYSVLARLDVEVDYAAIERSFLPPPP